jgi:hypothetical protein
VYRSNDKSNDFVLRFTKEQCSKCSLYDKCISSKSGKTRILRISEGYVALTKDLHRNQTEEYKEATNRDTSLRGILQLW